MTDVTLHILPDERIAGAPAPALFTYPYCYTPHPWARCAAEEVMAEAHQYMAQHPNSELHRQGKMFGVLVVRSEQQIGYIKAFSAMLDGTYHHPGYVEPIVDISHPDGYFKQEEARISAINHRIQQGAEDSESLKRERKERSQALQRWMFAEYKMLNGKGETKDLLQIFANEKPILTEEEFYQQKRQKKDRQQQEVIPPSGSGECCAPKLLQAAFKRGLQPVCMAEFWIGAATEREIHFDSRYYGACLSKCKPILTHMLEGIDTEENPLLKLSREKADEIQVLYNDTAILVVNKPSGLLSAEGKEGGYCVTDWAKEKGLTTEEAKPAHRLDQDTSGILIIAKTPAAYKNLQAQFVRRDVMKRYEAVLSTTPREKEGVIDLPLLADPFDRPRQMVDYAHGKVARTRYRVRQQLGGGRCLMDLFPETGRTHQLRVHCAHLRGLNAPIEGDRLYGTNDAAQRLMLCAAEIRFPHPDTGEEMHFLVKGF